MNRPGRDYRKYSDTKPRSAPTPFKVASANPDHAAIRNRRVQPRPAAQKKYAAPADATVETNSNKS